MWNAVKRWWKYRIAQSEKALHGRADPAVQLEQAISEAQDQHRRLKEQAANVIANQKQAEMRLSRSMDEYEKLAANTRQAVIMADRSCRADDQAKAAEYSAAAEAFANRLIILESELEQTKTLALQASQASEQAKAAVATNAQALQKKLAERQKLMSQLDQAKMQEHINSAMATLDEAVGSDVPTFVEVRAKIEARYAKAKAVAELDGQNVETRLLEVEQAAMNTEAQGRLSEIRASLGIEPPAEPSVLAPGQNQPGPLARPPAGELEIGDPRPDGR